MATQAFCPSPPDIDVRHGFEPLDADGLELLDVFLRNAEIVSRSRFARHLGELGLRPRVMIDRRFKGGGGEGRIRVASVSVGVRHEAFTTLRKLRTESNWASLAGVRNLLHAHSRGLNSDDAQRVVEWLKHFKKLVREASHGPSLTAFRVTDDDGSRAYDTTGKVLSLVENATVFHDERTPLRDLQALPEPLVDPVVDHGLKQIAELTLALASLASRVATEPALRRR